MADKVGLGSGSIPPKNIPPSTGETKEDAKPSEATAVGKEGAQSPSNYFYEIAQSGYEFLKYAATVAEAQKPKEIKPEEAAAHFDQAEKEFQSTYKDAGTGPDAEAQAKAKLDAMQAAMPALMEQAKDPEVQAYIKEFQGGDPTAAEADDAASVTAGARESQGLPAKVPQDPAKAKLAFEILSRTRALEKAKHEYYSKYHKGSKDDLARQSLEKQQKAEAMLKDVGAELRAQPNSAEAQRLLVEIDKTVGDYVALHRDLETWKQAAQGLKDPAAKVEELNLILKDWSTQYDKMLDLSAAEVQAKIQSVKGEIVATLRDNPKLISANKKPVPNGAEHVRVMLDRIFPPPPSGTIVQPELLSGLSLEGMSRFAQLSVEADTAMMSAMKKSQAGDVKGAKEDYLKALGTYAELRDEAAARAMDREIRKLLAQGSTPIEDYKMLGRIHAELKGSGLKLEAELKAEIASPEWMGFFLESSMKVTNRYLRGADAKIADDKELAEILEVAENLVQAVKIRQEAGIANDDPVQLMEIDRLQLVMQKNADAKKLGSKERLELREKVVRLDVARFPEYIQALTQPIQGSWDPGLIDRIAHSERSGAISIGIVAEFRAKEMMDNLKAWEEDLNNSQLEPKEELDHRADMAAVLSLVYPLTQIGENPPLKQDQLAPLVEKNAEYLQALASKVIAEQFPALAQQPELLQAIGEDIAALSKEAIKRGDASFASILRNPKGLEAFAAISSKAYDLETQAKALEVKVEAAKQNKLPEKKIAKLQAEAIQMRMQAAELYSKRGGPPERVKTVLKPAMDFFESAANDPNLSPASRAESLLDIAKLYQSVRLPEEAARVYDQVIAMERDQYLSGKVDEGLQAVATLAKGHRALLKTPPDYDAAKKFFQSLPGVEEARQSYHAIVAYQRSQRLPKVLGALGAVAAEYAQKLEQKKGKAEADKFRAEFKERAEKFKGKLESGDYRSIEELFETFGFVRHDANQGRDFYKWMVGESDSIDWQEFNEKSLNLLQTATNPESTDHNFAELGLDMANYLGSAGDFDLFESGAKDVAYFGAASQILDMMGNDQYVGAQAKSYRAGLANRSVLHETGVFLGNLSVIGAESLSEAGKSAALWLVPVGVGRLAGAGARLLGAGERLSVFANVAASSLSGMLVESAWTGNWDAFSAKGLATTGTTTFISYFGYRHIARLSQKLGEAAKRSSTLGQRVAGQAAVSFSTRVMLEMGEFTAGGLFEAGMSFTQEGLGIQKVSELEKEASLILRIFSKVVKGGFEEKRENLGEGFAGKMIDYTTGGWLTSTEQKAQLKERSVDLELAARGFGWDLDFNSAKAWIDERRPVDGNKPGEKELASLMAMNPDRLEAIAKDPSKVAQAKEAVNKLYPDLDPNSWEAQLRAFQILDYFDVKSGKSIAEQFSDFQKSAESLGIQSPEQLSTYYELAFQGLTPKQAKKLTLELAATPNLNDKLDVLVDAYVQPGAKFTAKERDYVRAEVALSLLEEAATQKKSPSALLERDVQAAMPQKQSPEISSEAGPYRTQANYAGLPWTLGDIYEGFAKLIGIPTKKTTQEQGMKQIDDWAKAEKRQSAASAKDKDSEALRGAIAKRPDKIALALDNVVEASGITRLSLAEKLQDRLHRLGMDSKLSASLVKLAPQFQKSLRTTVEGILGKGGLDTPQGQLMAAELLLKAANLAAQSKDSKEALRYLEGISHAAAEANATMGPAVSKLVQTKEAAQGTVGLAIKSALFLKALQGSVSPGEWMGALKAWSNPEILARVGDILLETEAAGVGAPEGIQRIAQKFVRALGEAKKPRDLLVAFSSAELTPAKPNAQGIISVEEVAGKGRTKYSEIEVQDGKVILYVKAPYQVEIYDPISKTWKQAQASQELPNGAWIRQAGKPQGRKLVTVTPEGEVYIQDAVTVAPRIQEGASVLKAIQENFPDWFGKGALLSQANIENLKQLVPAFFARVERTPHPDWNAWQMEVANVVAALEPAIQSVPESKHAEFRIALMKKMVSGELDAIQAKEIAAEVLASRLPKGLFELETQDFEVDFDSTGPKENYDYVFGEGVEATPADEVEIKSAEEVLDDWWTGGEPVQAANQDSDQISEVELDQVIALIPKKVPSVPVFEIPELRAAAKLGSEQDVFRGEATLIPKSTKTLETLETLTKGHPELQQNLSELIRAQDFATAKISFLSPDQEHIGRVLENSEHLLNNPAFHQQLEKAFGPNYPQVVKMAALLSKIGFAHEGLNPNDNASYAKNRIFALEILDTQLKPMLMEALGLDEAQYQLFREAILREGTFGIGTGEGPKALAQSQALAKERGVDLTGIYEQDGMSRPKYANPLTALLTIASEIDVSKRRLQDWQTNDTLMKALVRISADPKVQQLFLEKADLELKRSSLKGEELVAYEKKAEALSKELDKRLKSVVAREIFAKQDIFLEQLTEELRLKGEPNPAAKAKEYFEKIQGNMSSVNSDSYLWFIGSYGIGDISINEKGEIVLITHEDLFPKLGAAANLPHVKSFHSDRLKALVWDINRAMGPSLSVQEVFKRERPELYEAVSQAPKADTHTHLKMAVDFDVYFWNGTILSHDAKLFDKFVQKSDKLLTKLYEGKLPPKLDGHSSVSIPSIALAKGEAYSLESAFKMARETALALHEFVVQQQSGRGEDCRDYRDIHNKDEIITEAKREIARLEEALTIELKSSPDSKRALELHDRIESAKKRVELYQRLKFYIRDAFNFQEGDLTQFVPHFMAASEILKMSEAEEFPTLKRITQDVLDQYQKDKVKYFEPRFNIGTSRQKTRDEILTVIQAYEEWKQAQLAKNPNALIPEMQIILSTTKFDDAGKPYQERVKHKKDSAQIMVDILREAIQLEQENDPYADYSLNSKGEGDTRSFVYPVGPKDVLKYLAGLDAAGQEEYNPPSLFFDAYRIVEAYNAEVQAMGKPEWAIGNTFHVSESNTEVSPESALRYTLDAVFMRPLSEVGDGTKPVMNRLGHAIVPGIRDFSALLGTKPQERVAERLRQIDHDLKLLELGLPLQSVDKEGLLAERKDLLEKYPTPEAQEKAILELPEYTEARIKDLEMRASYTRDRLIELGITVETNPTSNVGISPYITGYQNHTLKTYLNYEYGDWAMKIMRDLDAKQSAETPLTSAEEQLYEKAFNYLANAKAAALAGKTVKVTVNTDDLTIFGTNLSEEFYRMGVAMDLGVEKLKSLISRGFSSPIRPLPQGLEISHEASKADASLEAAASPKPDVEGDAKKSDRKTAEVEVGKLPRQDVTPPLEFPVAARVLGKIEDVNKLEEGPGEVEEVSDPPWHLVSGEDHELLTAMEKFYQDVAVGKEAKIRAEYLFTARTMGKVAAGLAIVDEIKKLQGELGKIHGDILRLNDQLNNSGLAIALKKRTELEQSMTKLEGEAKVQNALLKKKMSELVTVQPDLEKALKTWRQLGSIKSGITLLNAFLLPMFVRANKDQSASGDIPLSILRSPEWVDEHNFEFETMEKLFLVSYGAVEEIPLPEIGLRPKDPGQSRPLLDAVVKQVESFGFHLEANQDGVLTFRNEIGAAFRVRIEGWTDGASQPSGPKPGTAGPEKVALRPDQAQVFDPASGQKGIDLFGDSIAVPKDGKWILYPKGESWFTDNKMLGFVKESGLEVRDGDRLWVQQGGKLLPVDFKDPILRAKPAFVASGKVLAVDLPEHPFDKLKLPRDLRSRGIQIGRNFDKLEVTYQAQPGEKLLIFRPGESDPIEVRPLNAAASSGKPDAERPIAPELRPGDVLEIHGVAVDANNPLAKFAFGSFGDLSDKSKATKSQKGPVDLSEKDLGAVPFEGGVGREEEQPRPMVSMDQGEQRFYLRPYRLTDVVTSGVKLGKAISLDAANQPPGKTLVTFELETLGVDAKETVTLPMNIEDAKRMGILNTAGEIIPKDRAPTLQVASLKIADLPKPKVPEPPSPLLPGRHALEVSADQLPQAAKMEIFAQTADRVASVGRLRKFENELWLETGGELVQVYEPDGKPKAGGISQAYKIKQQQAFPSGVGDAEVGCWNLRPGDVVIIGDQNYRVGGENGKLRLIRLNVDPRVLSKAEAIEQAQKPKTATKVYLEVSFAAQELEISNARVDTAPDGTLYLTQGLGFNVVDAQGVRGTVVQQGATPLKIGDKVYYDEGLGTGLPSKAILLGEVVAGEDGKAKWKPGKEIMAEFREARTQMDLPALNMATTGAYASDSEIVLERQGIDYEEVAPLQSIDREAVTETDLPTLADEKFEGPSPWQDLMAGAANIALLATPYLPLAPMFYDAVAHSGLLGGGAHLAVGFFSRVKGAVKGWFSSNEESKVPVAFPVVGRMKLKPQMVSEGSGDALVIGGESERLSDGNLPGNARIPGLPKGVKIHYLADIGVPRLSSVDIQGLECFVRLKADGYKEKKVRINQGGIEFEPGDQVELPHPDGKVILSLRTHKVGNQEFYEVESSHEILEQGVEGLGLSFPPGKSSFTFGERNEDDRRAAPAGGLGIIQNPQTYAKIEKTVDGNFQLRPLASPALRKIFLVDEQGQETAVTKLSPIRPGQKILVRNLENPGDTANGTVFRFEAEVGVPISVLQVGQAPMASPVKVQVPVVPSETGRKVPTLKEVLPKPEPVIAANVDPEKGDKAEEAKLKDDRPTEQIKEDGWNINDSLQETLTVTKKTVPVSATSTEKIEINQVLPSAPPTIDLRPIREGAPPTLKSVPVVSPPPATEAAKPSSAPILARLGNKEVDLSIAKQVPQVIYREGSVTVQVSVDALGRYILKGNGFTWGSKPIVLEFEGKKYQLSRSQPNVPPLQATVPSPAKLEEKPQVPTSAAPQDSPAPLGLSETKAELSAAELPVNVEMELVATPSELWDKESDKNEVRVEDLFAQKAVSVATLSRDEQGGLILQIRRDLPQGYPVDLTDKNNTLKKGEKGTLYDPISLSEGDRISIGPMSVLKFVVAKDEKGRLVLRSDGMDQKVRTNLSKDSTVTSKSSQPSPFKKMIAEAGVTAPSEQAVIPALSPEERLAWASNVSPKERLGLARDDKILSDPKRLQNYLADYERILGKELYSSLQFLLIDSPEGRIKIQQLRAAVAKLAGHSYVNVSKLQEYAVTALAQEGIDVSEAALRKRGFSKVLAMVNLTLREGVLPQLYPNDVPVALTSENRQAWVFGEAVFSALFQSGHSNAFLRGTTLGALRELGVLEGNQADASLEQYSFHSFSEKSDPVRSVVQLQGQLFTFEEKVAASKVEFSFTSMANPKHRVVVEGPQGADKNLALEVAKVSAKQVDGKIMMEAMLPLLLLEKPDLQAKWGPEFRAFQVVSWISQQNNKVANTYRNLSTTKQTVDSFGEHVNWENTLYDFEFYRAYSISLNATSQVSATELLKMVRETYGSGLDPKDVRGPVDFSDERGKGLKLSLILSKPAAPRVEGEMLEIKVYDLKKIEKRLP